MSDFQLQGKLLQKLYEAGELVLLHDYRSRSLRDFSGKGGHGVGTDITWSGNGVRFPESTSQVEVPDSSELQLTEGTCVILSDASSQTTTEQMVSKRDGGGTNYDFYLQADGMRLYDGSGVRLYDTDTIGKGYQAVNFKNGEVPDFYLDGVFAGVGNGAAVISVNDAPVTIGNYYTGNNNIKSTIHSVVIVNRKLTDTEHSQLYAELSEMQFPTITQLVSNAHLLVDPEESGLAGGWNMKPVNGELIDQSANRNDGTIVGATHEDTPLGDALRFNGSSNYVNCVGPYALTDLTVSFWFRSDDVSTSTWIFNYYGGSGDAWGLRYSSGNIFIYDDIDNADVALYSNTIQNATWYRVDVVMNALENKLYLNGVLVGSGTSSSAAWSSFSGTLYLGARHSSASFYNGLMIAPKIHNEAKDQTWVTKEYQRGLAAGWHSDWGVNESIAAVTSGPLENSPVVVDSGSFKISMDSIGDGPLGKVIECVSTGYCHIPTVFFKQTPTEAALGEWEFWVNKADASFLIVLFIASGTGRSGDSDNYNFIYRSDETVDIRRNSSPDVIDGGGITYAALTWHHVRITRDPSGLFSLFMDGVSVGTPGVDATYLISNYVNFDLDIGDKIALSDRGGEHSIKKRILV